MAKYKKTGRIQQKVDTYDNWETNKPDILAGEICVATNCPEPLTADEVMIKIPRKDANWEEVPYFNSGGGGGGESYWGPVGGNSLQPRLRGHIYVNVNSADTVDYACGFPIDSLIPYTEVIEYDSNDVPLNGNCTIINQYTSMNMPVQSVVNALQKMTHTTKGTQAYSNAITSFMGMYIKTIEYSEHKKEIVSNVMLLDSDGNVIASNVNIQNNDLSDPDHKPTVAILIDTSLAAEDRIAKIIIS